MSATQFASTIVCTNGSETNPFAGFSRLHCLIPKNKALLRGLKKRFLLERLGCQPNSNAPLCSV